MRYKESCDTHCFLRKHQRHGHNVITSVTEAYIQQRMYLLRKLNSFSVSSVILCRFYQSFIESLISFSFICWFRNLVFKDHWC
jgi:hypothetical protein